jgi:hypothetical protein
MAEEIVGADIGQVENEPYCMKKSFQCRNVREMNEMMGRFDMSDLANAPPPVTPATGEKRNVQLNAKPANPRMNDAKGKAY